MTTAEARASMARFMAKYGRMVTFERPLNSGGVTTKTVRARVTGYDDAELVGGMNIGDRKIILSYEDAVAAGLPVPFKKGTDAFIVSGTRLTVESVDDSTRRVDDGLVAYEIRASGA